MYTSVDLIKFNNIYLTFQNRVYLTQYNENHGFVMQSALERGLVMNNCVTREGKGNEAYRTAKKTF